MTLIKKYIVELVLVAIAVGLGAYFWVQESNKPEPVIPDFNNMQVQEAQ